MELGPSSIPKVTIKPEEVIIRPKGEAAHAFRPQPPVTVELLQKLPPPVLRHAASPGNLTVDSGVGPLEPVPEPEKPVTKPATAIPVVKDPVTGRTFRNLKSTV